MKTILKLSFLVSLFVLASCEKAEIVSFEETGETASVRILTRGAENGELDYPIYIYAFAKDGTLFKQQVIESADTDLRLKLAKNKAYQIVAVAADKSVYDIPSTPTLTSSIKMKDNSSQCATRPLQMGFAEVELGAVEANVRIQLYYQVCSLNILLKNMPDECMSPSVSVASCFEGVKFDGSCVGSKNVTIACSRKESSDFESGDVFVFPTSGNQTVFTIRYNDENGDQFSSATYKSTLNAGVPYRITGSHDNGFMALTGSITRPEWASPIDFSFDFGSAVDEKPAVPDNGNENPVSGNEDFTVSEIPSQFSIWQGHIVADVTPYGDETATLLLLSLEDWNNMTSSLNESTPTKAKDTAKAYQEYGLTGWSIPDGAQAKRLYQLYQSTFEGRTLEDAVESADDAQPIYLTEKGENVRYLCTNATRTFSFKTSSVLDAGKTIKNYHLRLVKEVKVKRGN